jgi:RNA-splicing ligase RtcB
VFACPRIDVGDDIAERLGLIARQPAVTAVVGLPDIHLKAKLESPSSTAVGTRESFSPQLSSPSPNCGMALLAVDLQADDVLDRLDELFAVLRGVVPMKRSMYRVSDADVLRTLREGAAFTAGWASHMDYPLERVDDRGALALPLADQLEELVSPALRRLAADDYGALGGGNHFLEVQRVARVADAAAANMYGVTEGQTLVFFHTGSGMFGYDVGRLYAYRRKISPRLLPRITARKVAFHARRGRDWGERWRRYRLFVHPALFSWVDASSHEGREAVTALNAAMNFGYANRAAVAAAIAAAIQAVFGETGVRLVCDTSHNSITQHDGLWVHRHNTARAVPAGHDGSEPFGTVGRPILLPGIDRSSSYLLRPGPGATRSLFSVDHGAGGTVLALGRPLPGPRATQRFHFDGRVESVGHLSDDGLDCVAGTLAEEEIAHVVAQMTPIAVLKQ